MSFQTQPLFRFQSGFINVKIIFSGKNLFFLKTKRGIVRDTIVFMLPRFHDFCFHCEHVNNILHITVLRYISRPDISWKNKLQKIETFLQNRSYHIMLYFSFHIQCTSQLYFFPSRGLAFNSSFVFVLTTGFWGKEAWCPTPKWNTRFFFAFSKRNQLWLP